MIYQETCQKKCPDLVRGTCCAARDQSDNWLALPNVIPVTCQSQHAPFKNPRARDEGAVMQSTSMSDSFAGVPMPGEQSVFLQNILESSTEYSIIGKDLSGKILL